MTEDEATILHCLTKAEMQLLQVCDTLIHAGQLAHAMHDTRLQHQLEDQVYALMQVKEWVLKEWGARCLAEQK